MKKEVLHVAAEAAPFAKVGGLADVVGSLPIALNQLASSFKTTVVIPCYPIIDKKKFGLKPIKELEISFQDQAHPTKVWQTARSKVNWYFIENQRFLGGAEIYFTEETNVKDQAQRFQFFATAVADLINQKILKAEIVHCHDWHSAPLLPFIDCPSVYTIHNLANQGPGKGEQNYMELGIRRADIVTTVSPNYRNEILTKEFGEGLERVLQSRQENLFGILNGIDYTLFNPKTDPDIDTNYNQSNLEKKIRNKEALLKELRLKNDPKRFLIGTVSRLTAQKGIELAAPLFRQFPQIQWVVLGTGQPKFEKVLKETADKQNNVKVIIDFDLKLAKKIYAGADLFLMPSRFEPCGLGQMIAMHYGSLPLVRAVGGLKDTVSDPIDGFLFQEDCQLANKITEAEEVYLKKPQRWQKRQQTAMDKDFSWKRSANKYLKLYQRLVA